MEGKDGRRWDGGVAVGLNKRSRARRQWTLARRPDDTVGLMDGQTAFEEFRWQSKSTEMNILNLGGPTYAIKSGITWTLKCPLIKYDVVASNYNDLYDNPMSRHELSHKEIIVTLVRTVTNVRQSTVYMNLYLLPSSWRHNLWLRLAYRHKG